MEIARRSEISPYVTRDGSEIREWVAPCVPPYSHDDTSLVD